MRFPDELWQIITDFKRLKAFRRELTRVLARTTTYSSVIAGDPHFYMFQIRNGDHGRALGFNNGRLQSDIIMFRQQEDAPLLEFHVYYPRDGPKVSYHTQWFEGDPF